MAAFAGALHKVREAAHFLTLMRLAELPNDGRAPKELVGPTAFKFAFSAFVSAARAVPYVLQEEGASVPGFTRWYVSAREQLLNDDSIGYFTTRNVFHLVFPDEIDDVVVPPGRTVTPQVEPPAEDDSPVRVDPQTVRGVVRFGDRPEASVVALCAHYLELLARVTDFARLQLVAAAGR